MGIDVSLEESSVCIVDTTGTIVREINIASEPEALVAISTNWNYLSAALGSRPGNCRNGYMPDLWPPDTMRFCSRRGT